MKDFVAYIVKNLVDHRDQVHIKETGEAKTLAIELTVEKVDIGKVIGKRGRTIRAIRTLLMSLASKHGIRVTLEVLEEGRPISSEDEATILDQTLQDSPTAFVGEAKDIGHLQTQHQTQIEGIN